MQTSQRTVRFLHLSKGKIWPLTKTELVLKATHIHMNIQEYWYERTGCAENMKSKQML